MFGANTSTNVPNSSQSLFGHNQISAPFALPVSRGIFSSGSGNNNSFTNSLASTTVGVGNSFFSSAFSTTASNSFFNNASRGDIFNSVNTFSPSISSSSFPSLGNSGFFSNQSKIPTLGTSSQTNGVFHQTPSIFSNVTGPGTPIPFRAVQSQDTVMKGGTQINVQVRLECIPAMKEYENKSLEELRYEDYISGRKGNSNLSIQSQAPNSGIFSNISANNLNNRGLFGSASSSNIFSPNPTSQSSNLFTPKIQPPLFAQVSQNAKSFVNSSNSLFPNIVYTQSSNIFNPPNPQQYSSMFPTVNSTQQNTPGLFLSNSSSSSFATKSNFGVGNGHSNFSIGANQFARPSGLFQLQPSNVNVGSHIPPSQSSQLGMYPPRALDLSFRKSANSTIGPQISGLNSQAPIFLPTNPIGSYPEVMNESPLILERQLLFLARTPFGDSPLFKDARQTVESVSPLDKKKHSFKNLNEQSSHLKIKPTPPSNIFKMNFQTIPLLPKESSSLSNTFLNEIDEKYQTQKNQDDKVLVSRKISVKQLDLSNKAVQSMVSIENPNFDLSSCTEYNPEVIDLSCRSITKSVEIDTEDSSADDIALSAINQPSRLDTALIDEFHIEHELLTLKRADYYTSPTCLEITKLISPDNKLIISNFTIFRHGYGQIFYPGVTDITGLNIDENVFIERKEVSVYPNEKNKPILGQKLNKEAYISLTEVWPICKTTREAITDPSKILTLRYYEKVERSTEKLGAQFIDYDPEGGVWKFKVLHFSKFKLDVSESSDDSEEFDKSDKKKSEKKIHKKSFDVIDKNFQSKDSNQCYGHSKQTNDTTFGGVPLSNSLNAISNDPFQMDILFSKTESLDKLNIKNVCIPLHTNRNNFFRQNSDNLLSFNDGGHCIPEKLSICSLDWNIPNIDLSHPLVILPKQESFLDICLHNIADSTLYINRSFRVGWSNSLISTIALPNNIKTSQSSFSVSIIKFSEEHKRHFTLFNTISLEIFFDTLYQFTYSHVFAALNEHSDLIDLFSYYDSLNLYKRLQIASPSTYQINDDSIWELLLIILSKRCCNNMAYSLHVKLYDNFSTWLSQLHKRADFKFDLLEGDYLFEIFYELTKGNLHSACCLALNNNDYQLSNAISQSLTNKSSKYKLFISQQIFSWLSNEAFRYISPIRFVIYCILSGEFEHLFSRNAWNIFLHLTWFQSFSLLLWFTQSPNSDISNSLLSFNELHHRGYFPYPGSLHCKNILLPRKSSTPDLFYSLISNAFIDYPFSKVLNVASYSHLFLDYSLAFHVLLSLFQFEHTSALQRSNIIMNFANQLFMTDQWHWGLYVMLFLPPSAQKFAALNNMIEAYCTVSKNLSKREQFISNELHFTQSLLFCAKSNLALYYKNYILYSDFSIQAEQPHLAHESIIRHIVCPCIINGEFEVIKDKIRQIECAGRMNLIEHWEIEGSIFLDYIRIFESITKLLDGYRCSAFELQELLQGVRSLCYRTSRSKMNSNNLKHFLAISEISKNLVLFLKMLVTIENNSLDHKTTFSQESIQHFTKLPLLCDNLTGVCIDMCESYLVDIS